MNACTISDENNPLSQTIPDAPTELTFFIKLCEQRRKFPVLYKIEFTVSFFTFFSSFALSSYPFRNEIEWDVISNIDVV